MKKQKRRRGVSHRIVLTMGGGILLLTLMAVFSKPQPSLALAGDLSSAMNKYPSLSSSSLNSCDLCHTASVPNLNPYGSAYKSNGRNTAAFGAIENLDSDGDGFTNIQEINALTFPGNASSKPAAPTATNTPDPVPTDTPTPSSSASTTIGLTPSSVMVGESSAAEVSLNNVPAGGYASVEFACTYDPALVEVSNIATTNLFGTDSATVTNGPQNGSFIVAIAGSNGNKALAGGAAFTFSAKGLQVGQSAIDCQTRVSTGNLVLATIPSTPANLDITSTTSTPGTFTGQVLANKSVTVTLYNPDSSVAGSVAANPDGTFSISVPAGDYTAVASAPGYLKAQGSVSITDGNTTSLPTISLIAGDIDGNDVIDQFDALTIGINYNGSTPAEADLNNDGTINVLDLEILANNYRLSGSLTWQ